jgi:hypothetical protein
MIPLLMPHQGRHRREYEPGPLALFFRRAIAAVRRKPAVPAVAAAGAATVALAGYLCCVHCLDGSPCEPRHGHREPCYDCDGALAPGAAASVLLANRNAEALGFGMRIGLTPAEHADAMRELAEPYLPAGEHPYPWPPVPRPGFPAPAEGWRADDTRYDLPVARPYAPLNGNDQTRELYFAPVFGQVPVAEVLESERLAGVTQQ